MSSFDDIKILQSSHNAIAHDYIIVIYCNIFHERKFKDFDLKWRWKRVITVEVINYNNIVLCWHDRSDSLSVDAFAILKRGRLLLIAGLHVTVFPIPVSHTHHFNSIFVPLWYSNLMKNLPIGNIFIRSNFLIATQWMAAKYRYTEV